MNAWLLPEQISDVLPSEAFTVESLRRRLLDEAVAHGYELVIPPALEHVDSLLSGTGQDLELQTFKLVDPLSGRTLGLRADMTPQAARIDAHLLNRKGITRLCYCGSVVHTHAQGVNATREPLQFGVELYGHAGLEADIEVQRLAVQGLRLAGVRRMTLALSDARLVRGILGGMVAGPEHIGQILEALARKDVPRLEQLTLGVQADQRGAILALPDLFGDVSILEQARAVLPDRPLVARALEDLDRLARLHAGPDVDVQIDLADLRGYHYHTGVIFGLFADSEPDALVRGGRYDEIGATFGRPRPATGCTLDLRALARHHPRPAPRLAVMARWSAVPGYSSAVRELRDRGECVIEQPADAELEGLTFRCDRELAFDGERWNLRPYHAG